MNAHHIDPTAKIHPTAIVEDGATIGEGSTIGPYAFVGAGAVLGPNTTLDHHAAVESHTVMGSGNRVWPGAVIGGQPQDKAYNPDTPGELVIGDNNIFREHVTINRSTHPHRTSRIGSRNYFMAAAHTAHNTQVGDDNVFANATALAGHSTVGNRCVFSSHTAVHQFTCVGDFVMFQGGAKVSSHVPPFTIAAGINTIVALNVIGLRRAPHLTDQDRKEIKQVFREYYRTASTTPALTRLDEMLAKPLGEPAANFLRFIQDKLTDTSTRKHGVCKLRSKSQPSD